MRTYLTGFKGSPNEPPNKAQTENEIRANVPLLDTCSKEARESIALVTSINRRFDDECSQEFIAWIKNKRNPEYWRIVVDMTNEITFRTYKAESKGKSLATDALKDRYKKSLQKLVDEHRPENRFCTCEIPHS